MLIDISADSIAGAYAYVAEGKTPILLYAIRVHIETRAGEPHERAMLRALQNLGETLVREGAPALVRATGSGSADSIFVSIDAPWQKTAVRTEYLEQPTPFIFSKNLAAAALKRTRAAPLEQLLVDESIISTLLNGYETRDPYGKRARRAEIVVLTSFLDARVSRAIYSTLGGLYHTKNIQFISGSSLRYQAMRMAFPLERNALMLDVTGPLTSIVLVRNALFVAIVDIAATAATGLWKKEVAKGLVELAKRYPLPRTIFLLARESLLSSLERAISAAELNALRLSPNPPNLVPIRTNHLVAGVHPADNVSPDIPLFLMVLYWHHQQNLL